MILVPIGNIMLSWKSFHDEDLIENIKGLRKVLNELANGTNIYPLQSGMWRGYEGGLLAYFGRGCQEYEYRGGDQRHTHPLLSEAWNLMTRCNWGISPRMPRWFGYAPVHMSHRSRLIQLRPTHYAHQWTDTPLDVPVLWPINEAGKFDFHVTISEMDHEDCVKGKLVPFAMPGEKEIKI